MKQTPSALKSEPETICPVSGGKAPSRPGRGPPERQKHIAAQDSFRTNENNCAWHLLSVLTERRTGGSFLTSTFKLKDPKTLHVLFNLNLNEII